MKRFAMMFCTAILLGNFGFPDTSAAFSPLHFIMIEHIKKCPACDLSGTYLVKADLNGATWTNGSKCKDRSIGQYNK